MALKNSPKITFTTFHAPLSTIRQPTTQPTANTRHSTNFSQDEPPMSLQTAKTRRNLFLMQPAIPIVEPLCGLDRMAVKIVTSDEGNEEAKKSQRFFESHQRLRTYASEEKITKRRYPRRCKIFEKRQGESRVSESKLPIEHHNNKGSLPKLNELTNSIFLQRETVLKPNGARIHSTSQTILRKQPIKTASPHRITFSYPSTHPTQQTTHQLSHSLMPTAHFPMSHNAKTGLMRESPIPVAVRSFIPIIDQQDQNQHCNPATTKIKKTQASMKVSILPQETIPLSWGNRIKASLIEPSKPREEILSKISLNICRDSMIRAKQNQLNDSYVLVDGSQRYFDDDEGFPTRDKLSYRNIEIEKQEEEHREEEIAPHNYLFIDFENSRRNDPPKEDSQIHTKTDNIPHSSSTPAILQQTTLVIDEKSMMNSIKEAYFPLALILLAALLLGIQIWA